MKKIAHPSLGANYEPDETPLGGSRHFVFQWTNDRAIDVANNIEAKLKNYGVDIQPPNRLALAARNLDQAGRFHLFDIRFGNDMEQRLAEANRTILEFYIICNSLLKHLPVPNKHILKRLNKMTEGTEIHIEGVHDLPRSIQAEFLTASIFWGARDNVKFEEPDLIIQNNNNMELGVAVKRVVSEKQYQRRVKDARKQLEMNKLKGFIVVNAEYFMSRMYFSNKSIDVSAELYKKVSGWYNYISDRDPEGIVLAVMALSTSFKLIRDINNQYFNLSIQFVPIFGCSGSEENIMLIKETADEMGSSISREIELMG